jgi:hypothetical protein
MTIRRFLLPPGLEQSAMTDALTRLVCQHARRGLQASGWVEDCYPDEPGWVDQPGNVDEEHKVYFATVSTTRRYQDRP